MALVEIEHEIKIESGVHARPAGVLANEASKFKSQINLNGTDVRKLLAVMGLGLKKNQKIYVTIDGTDEDEAKNAVQKVLAKHF
jgi:phosphocarrier protein